MRKNTTGILLIMLSFQMQLLAREWRSCKPDTLPDSYQTENQINPKEGLTIGDAMPGISFNAINAGLKNKQLSDYKGKLVIIDLWNIWCASCIASMPEMEKLQNEFQDKIAIVMVTANSSAQVDKLKSRNKILQNVHLPVVTDDKQFSNFFKPVTFPTHVWIDSLGIIRQITNGYNTTSSAISDWLSGNKKTLVVKKELSDYNVNAPLWEEGQGRNLNKIKSYSLLTSHIDYPQIGGTRHDSSTGNLNWIHMVNSSIYDLYQVALSMKAGISDRQLSKRSSFKVNDMERIKPPKDILLQDEWSVHNTWCYEIQVPPESSSKLADLIIEDLDRYFNLKTITVKKKINCWVLKRVSSNATLKFDTLSSLTDGLTDSTIRITNRPIQNSLLLYLEIIKKNSIIIDETNYSGLINMMLKWDKNRMDDLQESLRKHGLKFIPAVRLVDFFEIKDN